MQINFVFTCVVSFTETTDGEITLFIGDEVIDFELLFEKLLSNNDETFPIVMEFLRINRILPAKLCDVHANLGYSFISSNSSTENCETKWHLMRNLVYLKENECDLNLEMFNYLRSLTFGGKIVKRGQNFLEVVKILLPFCTDFFIDLDIWSKIRYICADTCEIITALNFLVINYGTENHFKFLPRQQKYEPFSLKHLSRNKVRENVWRSKTINQSYLTLCKENLPVMLFKFIKFEN